MPNPIKIQATVVSHIKITEGVFSLVLLPAKRRFSFYPGQFLHLAIDPYDPNGGFWPDSRVFSIASSPDSETIEIVYSVKGAYTKRMMNEIKVHDSLWLKFPYGNFIINNFLDSTVTKVVIIAGGTGISPFLSYFRNKNVIKDTSQKHLYWGVKSPEIFNIFQDIDEVLDESFTLHLFCENPDKTALRDYEIGILPIQEILKNQGNNASCLYFLSGPPRMIMSFKEYLLENQVLEENIIIDDWE
ncbi:Propane 2-monooxygenase, reductase component [bioreactor metagenome]|uniref:Propane 2-monooxygenase, reductase component n=1 Tax=bioreactor metagenome TaxID=1076179 RepID=A0A644YZS8_9ZZZZ